MRSEDAFLVLGSWFLRKLAGASANTSNQQPATRVIACAPDSRLRQAHHPDWDWLYSVLDGIVHSLMCPAPAPSASQARRQRVHDAVRALMAEQGFRISMDAVAARAGCSKQTLYADFGSKQDMLRSVMQEHLNLATARLEDGGDGIRTGLIAFAMEHLQRLSDPSVVTTCQLLSAEAAQFPEEARSLYREGCDTLQQRLADWLQLAMQRGQLHQAPPQPTAELLLGMVVGLDFERQRFAVPHRASPAQRQGWAEFAVDAFLRAFPAPAAVPEASTFLISKT